MVASQVNAARKRRSEKHRIGCGALGSRDCRRRPLRLEWLEDRRVLNSISLASLASATVGSYATQAPTDIVLSHNTVAEHAPANSLVGNLTATDADAGDTASFYLVDNANGRFSLAGRQLCVANPSLLSAGSYNVTIRATDSASLTYEESFSITVSSSSIQLGLLHALRAGGASTDTNIAVATDTSGNVYVTGGISGSVDFDPGPGVVTATGDVFLARYNAGGSLLWVRALSGDFGYEGGDIAVDDAGNAYLTGSFFGQVDFDPGSGTSILTSQDNYSGFVLKLNSAGSFVWARQIRSTFYMSCEGITVSGGNIYLAGGFQNTIYFDPSGAVSMSLSSAGARDAFVAKLDGLGQFVWARRFGSINDDRAFDLGVDPSGNVYTTGYFQVTVDFDPGAGIANMTAAGYEDIFVSKLDSSGNYLWAERIGGGASEDPTAMTVDSSGNVYLTGRYYGDTDFSPGPANYNLAPYGNGDIFVCKLDSNGDFRWADGFGSENFDQGEAISLDSAGNVYIAGTFQLAVDFDPGAGVANLTAAGSNTDDVFLLQLNAETGAYGWAGRMGGVTQDRGYGICVDPSNNVYVTGDFTGSADFDPGANQVNLTSAGDFDTFLCKFGYPPVPQSFVLSGPSSGSYTAGQNVTIQWTTANVLAGSTISLCYDSDTAWNGNERWIAIDGVLADIGSGSYAWNTAGVAPGNYYLAGYMYDGRGTFTKYHFDQPITITSQGQQTFAVTGPSSGTYFVGTTIAVQWMASNVVSGSKISLCYDSDTIWNGNERWIEIDSVTATNGSGSYNWSTTGVTPGQYYLAGYMYDGVGTFTKSHLTTPITLTVPVQQPTFSVTGPSSGTYLVGTTIAVQWTASNVVSGSKISLCYDSDTTWNGNERWVEIDQVTATNGTGSYNWSTAGVAPGQYYLAGYMYDGNFYTSHLTTPITLTVPVQQPAFTVTGPSSGTYEVGTVIAVQWSAVNVAAGSKISLCYDGDATFNGNEHWIAIDSVTATNGTGSYNWSTAGVAPGQYYLAGYMYDGNFYTSHLTTPITLTMPAQQPSFLVTGPSSGSYPVGTMITVQWTVANVNAGSKISLCYDSDTAWNGNEHWIEIDQVTAVNGNGGYQWNTSGVAAGQYYLAGYMYDGNFYTSHLTTPITLTALSATFAVTGPTSGSYQAGTTINVLWTASNVVAGSKISLCYDSDTTWNGNEHWIEIDQVTATNGDGSYPWNTTGVTPGNYYLAGYMYEPAGKFIQSHLTQAITITAPPQAQTFAVTGPTSGTYNVGNTVNVTWTASNFAPGSKISLCYDSDTTWNGNERWIEIDQVTPTSTAGSYPWNTAGVAPGNYYLAGYMYDGAGTFTRSHLTQAITIVAPVQATFAVTGPTSGTYNVGATIPVTYTASGVGSGYKISLCYDTDTSWNGNEHWIEVDQITATNGNGTYNWVTTGVAPGRYYLAGYMWTGTQAIYSHLNQSIVIQIPSAGPYHLTVTQIVGDGYVYDDTKQIDTRVGKMTGTYYPPDTGSHWLNASNAFAEFYNADTGQFITDTTLFFDSSTIASGLNVRVVFPDWWLLADPSAQLGLVAEADSLTDITLAPLVAEGISRWKAAAISVEAVERLSQFKVELADLPGNALAVTMPDKILVDKDAAGLGWFVDRTPNDDAEYAATAAPEVLEARWGDAMERVDLLTTVMHEMGHVLGYAHAEGSDLMSPTLAIGQRRLPTLADIDGFFASLDGRREVIWRKIAGVYDTENAESM